MFKVYIFPFQTAKLSPAHTSVDEQSNHHPVLHRLTVKQKQHTLYFLHVQTFPLLIGNTGRVSTTSCVVVDKLPSDCRIQDFGDKAMVFQNALGRKAHVNDVAFFIIAVTLAYSRLCQILIESVKVHGAYIRQLQVADSDIDTGKKSLIPGDGFRSQFWLGVLRHPPLGKVTKADIPIHGLPLLDPILEKDLLPLHFLFYLFWRHVCVRRPVCVLIEPFALFIQPTEHPDFIALTTQSCGSHISSIFLSWVTHRETRRSAP